MVISLKRGSHSSGARYEEVLQYKSLWGSDSLGEDSLTTEYFGIALHVRGISPVFSQYKDGILLDGDSLPKNQAYIQRQNIELHHASTFHHDHDAKLMTA